MKDSFGDSSRWLPLTVVVVLLVLVGFGGVTFLNAHARSVDAQKQAERVQAARVAKEWKASMATAVAKKKAQDRQDARLKAAEKRAAQHYKAQERAQERAAARRKAAQKAARKAAAKQKAAQAAAHKAAQVAAQKAAKQAKVAKQRAVAQQAADAQAAAQKAAVKKAKAAQAALIRAAAAAAAGAAEHQATVTLPVTRTIRGQVTEPDILNALILRVGGDDGDTVDDLSTPQLNEMRHILAKLKRGKTDRCPLGSGGVYGDIDAGAQVYVEDRARTAVAVSTLTGGVLSSRGCTFDFTVAVPDLPFYRVNVTHRDQMVFSHEDMVRQHWKVRLQTS